MTTYVGQLYNGRGELVGSGLQLAADGTIAEILPIDKNVTGYVIPGVIDIHCHGGGGASFPDGTDPEAIEKAIAAHREKGTTAMLASLVSMVDPIPVITALVPFCERGELLGIHMEGPYISPHKCGAQNPAAVRNPDLDELRSWLEAGKGWIKTMTIAPEVEDAIGAAKLLHEYGAVPSWGHTSGLSAQTSQQISATTIHAQEIGMQKVPQTATHLFNAMPSLAHREPGPVRELIQAARRGECVVELIADAVHVNLDLVGDVANYVADANPNGVVFVTDAMAGAGMPDGDYVLGSLPVKIVDGVARLAGGDNNIAGGTARLVEEIKYTVEGGMLSLPRAINACVAAPAAAIGATEDDPGVTIEFKVGEKPNLIVLDSEFAVQRVVREGEALTSDL
ncbi:N-acetylglucosamine-6-phosphate deacetylase [Arcanobacterium hippocoleae]|uniref:N-acetylglucosamine-6-phosphate deacetylase n=1 Tax=Arcanobacterium hippocoleae TaxID=149017 RepID=A0ABU1T313_9ACTO|nr:amidohydrolase family protein [Arcanobacterium hippocoleae]MDR6939756.1 N-acetylglucosamine-6-phosphate deacetylase [Arcanobacterium hippocoleae]